MRDVSDDLLSKAAFVVIVRRSFTSTSSVAKLISELLILMGLIEKDETKFVDLVSLIESSISKCLFLERLEEKGRTFEVKFDSTLA